MPFLLQERFLVSVIGANGWRGGYQDIPLSSRTPSFRRVDEVTPDSYLGERLLTLALKCFILCHLESFVCLIYIMSCKSET